MWAYVKTQAVTAISPLPFVRTNLGATAYFTKPQLAAMNAYLRSTAFCAFTPSTAVEADV